MGRLERKELAGKTVLAGPTPGVGGFALGEGGGGFGPACSIWTGLVPKKGQTTTEKKTFKIFGHFGPRLVCTDNSSVQFYSHSTRGVHSLTGRRWLEKKMVGSWTPVVRSPLAESVAKMPHFLKKIGRNF